MRVMTIGVKKGNVVVRDIEGTLTDLQFWVDGFIKVVPLIDFVDTGIVMLVNEEGCLAGLPANENLYPYFFVGRAVFVGVEGEEFVSLTDRQIEFIKQWLSE